MCVIREDDLVVSVADAPQYISYYHAPDFIRAMGRAYEAERRHGTRSLARNVCRYSRDRRVTGRRVSEEGQYLTLQP